MNRSNMNWKFWVVLVSIWTCTVAGWAQIPCVPDVGVPQTNGPVHAIKQYGNRVYVGGRFTEIGGVARNYLAAFDATTGAIDMTWDPDIGESSLYTRVQSIEIGGEYVYVGGYFETVNGGLERKGLVAFPLADESTLATANPNWDPAGGAKMEVCDIEFDGNFVYVGGYFKTVNGTLARSSLAAFELAGGGRTGLANQDWDPNPEDSSLTIVEDILVADGYLYCGGNFDTVNSSISRNNLAAFELAGGGATGAVDLVWNPNVNSGIKDILLHNDTLYIAGSIREVNGGISRECVAALEPASGGRTGLVDMNWDPQITYDYWGVQELSILDTLIYAGGYFSHVNGTVSRKDFAAFELAGNSRSGLVSSDVIADMTNSAGMYAVAPSIYVIEHSGSGLLVGGCLEFVNGQPYNYLVGFGSSIQSTAVNNWRVY